MFFLLALLMSRIMGCVSCWSWLGHDHVRSLKYSWGFTGHLNIGLIGITCRLFEVYWWCNLCSGRRGLGNGRPFIRFNFGLPPLSFFHLFHWLDLKDCIAKLVAR